MRAARFARLPQRGFTLIEMIIAIVVIGLLSVVGSTMIANTFTTTRMVNAGTASAEQAAYALGRVARELREVKINADGSYAISSALAPGATSMAFTRSVSGTDTSVTLALSGSDLTLGYGSTSSTLISGVSSFTLDFVALNATTGATSLTTSTSALRFVVIDLGVTDPTSGRVTTQRLRVALRNA